MDKTQEEKFEKWYRSNGFHMDYKRVSEIWCACLEANGIGEEPRIPEGYFKIGEKVGWRWPGEDHEWEEARIGIVDTDDTLLEIRRIPAWEPKDGEAVLYENCVFESAVGVYVKGSIYLGRTKQDASKMKLKPFDGDESKIGKPWSKI